MLQIPFPELSRMVMVSPFSRSKLRTTRGALIRRAKPLDWFCVVIPQLMAGLWRVAKKKTDSKRMCRHSRRTELWRGHGSELKSAAALVQPLDYGLQLCQGE